MCACQCNIFTQKSVSLSSVLQVNSSGWFFAPGLRINTVGIANRITSCFIVLVVPLCLSHSSQRSQVARNVCSGVVQLEFKSVGIFGLRNINTLHVHVN